MIAHQAPLSMAFVRQEYWSGLPFLSPGDLSHPGTELTSPLADGFFPTEPPQKPTLNTECEIKQEVSDELSNVPQIKGATIKMREVCVCVCREQEEICLMTQIKLSLKYRF